MVNDSISALITELKNAGRARQKAVFFPYSKLILAVAELLVKKGFILSVERRGKKFYRSIECEIAYTEDGRPKLTDFKRISKPGQRIYLKAREIRPVMDGIGLLVISTNKGVMSGEEAKQRGVGGEALFTVW
jgi:small subunit ribosomal protein S8